MKKDNGLMTAMLAVPIEGVIPSIVDASTNDKNMKMVMLNGILVQRKLQKNQHLIKSIG